MSQDEFTKLFKYFEENMVKKSDLAEFGFATKQDIDKIMDILDQHTALLQTHEIERHALSAQVDRHEKHVEQLAKNAKLKLDYTV